jgi:hypothetical protein
MQPAVNGILPLSRIVYEAHRLVNRLDVMIPACATDTQGPPEEILADLGLAAQAETIIEEYKAEFAAMRSFF